MNKKRSMFLCCLLSLVMLFALRTDYAHAYGIADNCGPYGLVVGNVIVTAENKDDIPVTSGKAVYNPSAKELTLYDVVITDWCQVRGGEIAGIFSNQSLTIRYSGDCAIDLSDAPTDNNNAEGIDVEGDSGFLYINRFVPGAAPAGRSLTVVAPGCNVGYSFGIWCKNTVTIYNDGTKMTEQRSAFPAAVTLIPTESGRPG